MEGESRVLGFYSATDLKSWFRKEKRGREINEEHLLLEKVLTAKQQANFLPFNISMMESLLIAKTIYKAINSTTAGFTTFQMMMGVVSRKILAIT